MDIQVDDDGNPILDQFSEEGFVDLCFQLTDLAEDDDCYRFHLAASHKGAVVGMDCVLVKGIEGAFDDDMEFIESHVYRAGVRFLRSGAESDRLISAIQQLYGLGKQRLRMVDEEVFTAVALHQGDLDFDTDAVKLKLFGRDDEPFGEDDYYETFFNVDLGNGFVFWNEKDGEYRQPLVRALSRPA
ncbi:MAG TPA: hypothetical protein VHB77_22620 [Planctomycetaceae bacterium]|jgi:hypothetical protein|nr:hypothetical protein [Planctomycetaceae bacterium]